MLQISNKSISSILLLSFVILGSIFTISGCGSDTTTNTTPDANVIKYDSTDAYPTSNNSINLYDGLTTKSIDSAKDLTVVTNGAGGFLIQSGSLIVPGSNTMFVMVDTNDTKATFDAMSSVASWGTTIDPATFTLSTTGTLVIGQVYGFYLQGKFANGTLPNKVYGILRINNIVPAVGLLPKININIKLNKSGANKFN